ncbi:hypothetical protein WSM22_15040 [Cytophagales bacterium WSM2-2]|nr:hypothetical protein WSM22_15040 [Cytophagales bacterium WSM2-2]
MEDMTMKVYPLDSSASAVVLFDYGVSYLSSTANSMALFVERHVRIKILKKEGLDQADIAIRLYHESTTAEILGNLKAVTYNLEGGKIVSTSLSKEGTFKDKFNRNLDQVKFTFPNVKEGSVIEYSYKITSAFIVNFPSWKFQRTIPVRHSEYWAMIPEIFFFEKYLQGYVQVSSYNEEQTNYYGEHVKAQHYVSKNVPAFKAEPFMTTEDDFVSKVNYALSHYKSSDNVVHDYMGSWEKLVDIYLNDENFGKVISKSGFLKEEVDQVTTGKTELLQKIEAISNHIKKNYEWTGVEDNYISSVKQVMKDKKGSSGDLNLLMASMLDKAGIDVTMVLLSTRDHGMVRESYPMQKQFNYTVCMVKDGDKILLLDATEKYLPFDVLPSRCLNGRGLKVSKTNFGWIPLASKVKDKSFVNVNLTASDNGELKGKVEYSGDGYRANEMRDEYFVKGEEKYKKDFLSGRQWTVEKTEFKDMEDMTKSAKVSYDLSISEHATSAGEVIYVNPYVSSRIEENPFKSSTREYPVDFGSKIERAYNCKITLPEGFVVDELPQSMALALPDNGGRFIYNISQLGGAIIFTSNFQINKSTFGQMEYAHLREFYNRVVAKQAEQIVLKKK